jgi:protein-disulfide isomerase
MRMDEVEIAGTSADSYMMAQKNNSSQDGREDASDAAAPANSYSAMSSTERRTRLTTSLEPAATILLIVVTLLMGGLTVWDRLQPPPAQAEQAARREPPVPSEPVSIEGAPILGDRNAKVALIVFSEFECPYCARSAREVLPEIERQYLRTRKAFLVWRHFPLPIHMNAGKAAEGAECAGRQGKFWEFHDWAFEHQKELDQSNLRDAAKGLGLDPAAFGVCLDGQATAKVKADVEFANAMSVSGTPTWFIGVVQPDGKVRVTSRLTGAKPFGDLRQELDKAAATVESSGN